MVTEKTQKDVLYEACAAWYSTPAGEYALAQLDKKISNYLSRIFGYYAIEMGVLVNDHHFLDNSRVSSCYAMGKGQKEVVFKAEVDALPIAEDSVDLVVASHVLECAANPHQVLREIDRVLVPEGQCLLISFNSLALWHGQRAFCAEREQYANLYGVHRVRDWLSLLGWETLDVSYVSFRPSYLKGNFFKRMEKLEKWGELYWPIFANISIIHAKKQALIMPPAKRKRESRVIMPGKVAINPTSRSANNCDSSKD